MKAQNKQGKFTIFLAVAGMLMMIAGLLTYETATAETGRVVAIDNKGQFVTVESSGAAGRQNIQLRVSPQTQFSGASSLNEIQVGDEIQFQASQNAGVWSAQTLQRGSTLNQSGQTNTTPGQAPTTFGEGTTTTSSAFEAREELPRTGMPGTSQSLEARQAASVGGASQRDAGMSTSGVESVR